MEIGLVLRGTGLVSSFRCEKINVPAGRRAFVRPTHLGPRSHFFADFSAIYWKWSCIPWYSCQSHGSWYHLGQNLEENMMVHTIDSYYLKWKRYSHSFALLSNKIRNTWPIACIVMGYEYLYDTVSGIPPSTLLTANISTNILIYFVLGIERNIS